MPEIKHDFLKGRMNKDLDERLVPNGEYRDALNIEVSTSESSNVGAVETVMGNIKLSNLDIIGETTRCVGKILDEKNDKLYWLVSQAGNRPPVIPAPTTTALGGGQIGFGLSPAPPPPGVSYGTPPKYGDFIVSDLILEIDTTNNDIRPVVVDTFYTAVTATGYDGTVSNTSTGSTAGSWLSVESVNWSGVMDYTIYPGMEIDCVDGNGNLAFPEGTIVVDVDLQQWRVRLSNKANPGHDISLTNNPNSYYVKFENFDRALNFQNNLVNESSTITGINIVEDLLFWTDNNSEPKKINITTCKFEREANPYIVDMYDKKGQSTLFISDIDFIAVFKGLSINLS